jgi:hypothetical protein
MAWGACRTASLSMTKRCCSCGLNDQRVSRGALAPSLGWRCRYWRRHWGWPPSVLASSLLAPPLLVLTTLLEVIEVD